LTGSIADAVPDGSMARNTTRTYTVSEVSTLIKVALEGGLPGRLTVAGQISGFKRHASGHAYFALKDDKSVLAAVMWRSKLAAVRFAPEDGMAVLATGYIDLYEPTGKVQLYVDRLEPAGVGALQVAFEQMVKRLRAEGLFDDRHKKPLPRFPMRIGILTSPSGAAIVDIVNSIRSRWPCARLFFRPVPVQGAGAAEEIAHAVVQVNRENARRRLDLLIVGRGGGSLEDLWAFNEEVLARAIHASRIPIISAVGHEVDITIADLVADARASTPTQAGVIAVPDRAEVSARLDQADRRLRQDLRNRLDLSRQRLATILAGRVFREPQGALAVPAQRVDELAMRLRHAARQGLTRLERRLADAHQRVAAIEPRRVLAEQRTRLEALAGVLDQRERSVLTAKQLQCTALENRLQAMNPRAVLRRGYSLTRDAQTGRLITRSRDVSRDTAIVTELADEDWIESRVTSRKEADDRADR